jgi:hypothetical protein
MKKLWVHNPFTHSPTKHGGGEDALHKWGVFQKLKERGELCLSLTPLASD